jgi:hypothetical protein
MTGATAVGRAIAALHATGSGPRPLQELHADTTGADRERAGVRADGPLAGPPGDALVSETAPAEAGR